MRFLLSAIPFERNEEIARTIGGEKSSGNTENASR